SASSHVTAAQPAVDEARRTKSVIAIAGLVTLALLMVGGWWWFGRRPGPAHRSATGRKALAVLYFSNLSQDPSLNWLDRGLSEMLTTNLAQTQGLDVLSPERVQSSLQRLAKKGESNVDTAVAQAVAR